MPLCTRVNILLFWVKSIFQFYYLFMVLKSHHPPYKFCHCFFKFICSFPVCSFSQNNLSDPSILLYEMRWDSYCKTLLTFFSNFASCSSLRSHFSFSVFRFDLSFFKFFFLEITFVLLFSFTSNQVWCWYYRHLR